MIENEQKKDIYKIKNIIISKYMEYIKKNYVTHFIKIL